MKIAVVGLGKMGYQIVEKLLADNFEVIAFDSNSNTLQQVETLGAIIARTSEEVVAKFDGDEAAIWLMIPSDAVDEALAGWQSILSRNSILIDGGNSDFRLTQKRAESLKAQNIRFLDVGTSGGILGQKNGFSMMVGGDESAFNQVLPIFRSLAEPSGSYKYFGPSGTGHFVKMVHNAIEYGMMESLAEGYNLLKQGPYQGLDLGKIAEVWQHGSIIESQLNGLALEILSTNPELSGVEGVVDQTGEASWTLETAKQYNIGMPATQAALDVRTRSKEGQISFATKLLAELRNRFGGHNVNPQ